MKTLTKYWYLVVAFLLLTAAGIWYFTKKQEQEEIDGTCTDCGSSSTTSSSSIDVSNPIPIKTPEVVTNGLNLDLELTVGTQGSEVKELQELLVDLGASLAIDGIFGGNTAAALAMYMEVESVTLREARLYVSRMRENRR